MKIIIIGLGNTGTLLAERISMEYHDVMVIDESKSKVESITDRLNVSGICGAGASRETLMRAGANLADVIVALTPSDETNLMACAVAKQYGTRFSIAKMENPELCSEKKYYSEKFSVDCIITPKEDTALEIIHHIGLPGTVRAEGFFSSDATLIKAGIDSSSSLNGMAVRDVRNFMETDMLVVSVTREGKLYIPDASFIMKEGDLINIISSNRSLMQIMMKLELVRKKVKKVLIIGGGDVAYYLAGSLLKEKKSVTVLERNRDRCILLSQLLPNAKISCAEKIDEEVLAEEGIHSADVCVSLTGQDDTNLVVSMFAWASGVKSVITKVNSPSYEKLLNRVNIDITISPAVISADKIISFIRNQAVPNVKGDDIECMHRIAGGLAEAVEFTAYDDFRYRDIPFKDEKFRIKKNTIIAVIIRNGIVIIPDGNSTIKKGDKVIVITAGRKSRLDILNDIME